MKYKTIFISDVHLGSGSCKATELVNFLKHNECEKLVIIGDFFDGWKVAQNRWRWHKDQSKVVELILKMARKHGVRVIYVPGNHDEFIRPLINNFSMDNIEFHNTYTHLGLDGKRYLVVHGDLFDGITRVAPWISFLGDKLYDLLITCNTYVNAIRRNFGFGYWSLSQYLKYKVKKAVDFIFEFEKNLAGYCKKKGFDGVICGHIHHAEIKVIDGITYMNDGDWVESCTALVENFDGRFEIVTWKTNLPSLSGS